MFGKTSVLQLYSCARLCIKRAVTFVAEALSNSWRELTHAVRSSVAPTLSPQMSTAIMSVSRWTPWYNKRLSINAAILSDGTRAVNQPQFEQSLSLQRDDVQQQWRRHKLTTVLVRLLSNSLRGRCCSRKLTAAYWCRPTCSQNGGSTIFPSVQSQPSAKPAVIKTHRALPLNLMELTLQLLKHIVVVVNDRSEADLWLQTTANDSAFAQCAGTHLT